MVRTKVVKKSRRYGAVLFSNGQSKLKAYKKRKYPPGMHGRSSFRSLSEYGKQLVEKQKCKVLYNISEKQIRKYYDKAEKSLGITGEEMLKLIERRLDNVIYRAGIGISRAQTRQMVTHGHFMLNGRRVDIPSIQVRVGDVIELREKCQKSPLYSEIKNEKKDQSAKWLETDLSKVKVTVTELPDSDDIEKIIDSQLIVEFYSK
jgi:small subunit ribosomal protein S4